MTIKIQHKRSAVAGKAPLPADLEYGEIAVNYEATDPALYVKDSADAIRKIGELPLFTQAGTGAKPRSYDGKFKDTVSVKDFGAVGDGVADDTLAIQAACTAAKVISFNSSAHSYKVSGTITLTSGTTLLMQGATITQVTDQTPILNAVSTDGVTITGGRFVGKSESTYTNSASSLAIAIAADKVSNLMVTGNTFENFHYSALMVGSGGNRIIFSGNNVKGPGSAVLGVDINRRNTTGVTVIGQNVRITNNDIRETAQGIIVGQGSSDVSINGNIIHNLINEHGVYVDTGVRQLAITGNTIYSTGSHGTGVKVQCYDAFGVQSRGITITGNLIADVGETGILFQNTTVPTPSLTTLGVVIAGNSITGAGTNAIDLRLVEDCTVVGNTALAPGRSGIAWGGCKGILISDNYVQSSVKSGLRDLSPSANVTLKDNVIANCATAKAAGDSFGIFIDNGAADCTIDGNVISDANAKMQYGIYHIPALNSTLSITRNTVYQSTDTALRLGSTAAMREYRGNMWNGTLAPTYNDPVLPVVASAATITLPISTDVVSVSGTTNITAISTKGHSGRIVTLVFQGVLTVSNYGALFVSTNLTTKANSTLTLCCDGTNWYEVSRS